MHGIVEAKRSATRNRRQVGVFDEPVQIKKQFAILDLSEFVSSHPQFDRLNWGARRQDYVDALNIGSLPHRIFGHLRQSLALFLEAYDGANSLYFSDRAPEVLEGGPNPKNLKLVGSGAENWKLRDLHQYPSANRIYLCLNLFFNSPESSQSSKDSAKPNTEEGEGSESCNTAPSERPSIDILMVLFVCFGFGGLLLGFLPLYIRLLVPSSVNYERVLFGAALFGILSACCAVVGLFLTGVYPYSWGLPPSWIPQQWQPCQSQQQQKLPHSSVIVPQKHLDIFHLLGYSNYMANVLNTDKQIAIIGALAEGNSIRSIERMTGIHRDTIMRLGVRVGQGFTAMMDQTMRELPCTRLEMDEIWGFVGKKDRHVRAGDDPQLGNVWTFCAIDAETKLVPAFRVGNRDRATAIAFVRDVAERMKYRVQISTDGLNAYVDAMERAFGGDVDYGQVIKTYGVEEVQAQRRYSQPEITAIEKKAISGRPNFDLISTSYVERLNATTRLHMKRLARLTHAFSKKRVNFEAAVGLHFAYYNFVRRHNTLRCTPAMAAGVASSFWSVGDLLEAAA